MPASAQIAVEAAIQSDYRLRGYSLSDEKPVASVSLAYDDPSGFYLGGTASGTIRGGDPEPFALQGNIGYAGRVAPGVSIDGGVSRSQYYSGYGTSRNYHYTELYLGLATPIVTTRVRFSPDYFRADTPTIYVEAEGGIEPAKDWFLSAHAGALSYLEKPPFYLARRRYDWRLGVSRLFGPWGVHADLSGRIQKHTRYAPRFAAARSDDGAAAVLSLTRAF